MMYCLRYVPHESLYVADLSTLAAPEAKIASHKVGHIHPTDIPKIYMLYIVITPRRAMSDCAVQNTTLIFITAREEHIHPFHKANLSTYK